MKNEEGKSDNKMLENAPAAYDEFMKFRFSSHCEIHVKQENDWLILFQRWREKQKIGLREPDGGASVVLQANLFHA